MIYNKYLSPKPEERNGLGLFKNISQLPSPLFFNLIVPPPLFEKAVHRNRSVLAKLPNFFDNAKVTDTERRKK